MEGKQVTLFVTCLNQEAVIVLSEYDTVETLKIEINMRWDIEVRNQQITGWCNEPSSDDIILQVCCLNEVNCLKVRDVSETPSTSGTILDNSKSTEDIETDTAIPLQQKLTSNTPLLNLKEEENELDLQFEAIESMKSQFSLTVASPFREHYTLDAAITFICDSDLNRRKILLLYLHNPNEPFSQMFVSNLHGFELREILYRSFFVLGWNVEDSKYHAALECALNRYVNLSMVSNLVRNKVAAAICVFPVNDTISVSVCLRDKISFRESLKNLKVVVETFENEIKSERELKKLEDTKKENLNLNAEMLQSMWADMLGDRDYDSFEYNEHCFLEQKIGFGLKGPPQMTTGYTEAEKKNIDLLLRVIKEQSQLCAEYKDHIEMATVFVCLVPLASEKIKRAKKFGPSYNPNNDVTLVPLFILRKCRNSENACRIFIDNSGRVYKTWKDFLTKNKYPECEMVAPFRGRYVVKNNKVLLEKHLSPACHLDTKLLQVADVITTAAGLTSGAVIITASMSSIAIIPVVAPAVIVGATIVGAVSGLWAIGRSFQSLIDKSMHKESLSFANSEARVAYLHIVAGTLGFVGAGANMALSKCVQNGMNIGKSATLTVNTIGALNIGAGGASLINSTYQVLDQWISKKEPPSTLLLLQLGSSVLFFGHAVYNFKGAQTIVDETRAKVLQNYQESLRSNRHRKTFNGLLRETIKMKGDTAKGKAEVILAIKKIHNKDEFFASLTRNKKMLNEAGMRFSAEDGQITVGGLKVDMDKFVNLNKSQIEIYLNTLGQDTVKQQSTLLCNSRNSSSFASIIKRVLTSIKNNISGMDAIRLVNMTRDMLNFCCDDTKTKVMKIVEVIVNYVFDQFSAYLIAKLNETVPRFTQYRMFVRLVILYFSKKAETLESLYQLFKITTGKKYYDPIFETINSDTGKRIVQFFEYEVSKSFDGANLIVQIRNEISEALVGWIIKKFINLGDLKERESNREKYSYGFKTTKVCCSVCRGFYFRH